MKVRLIGKTIGLEEYKDKTIDEMIVGIARISSNRDINKLFEEPETLIRYCIINGHWSIFEMANLIFEIETSRAIGREYLRHHSLRPQEISQRYKKITEFENIELRKKAEKNRQSSEEIIQNENLNKTINDLLKEIKENYNNLIENDVSKETARFILPELTQTKIIFNGTIRSWITTLNQRLHKTAQKEARLIAEQIRDIMLKEVPLISKALLNFENAYEIHILDQLVLKKFNKI